MLKELGFNHGWLGGTDNRIGKRSISLSNSPEAEGKRDGDIARVKRFALMAPKGSGDGVNQFGSADYHAEINSQRLKCHELFYLRSGFGIPRFSAGQDAQDGRALVTGEVGQAGVASGGTSTHAGNAGWAED